MKRYGIGLSALAVLTAVFTFLILNIDERRAKTEELAGFPPIESNAGLLTPNTTRIGTDDPVQTAVAVSQIVYPVTEEENSPGAVILVNRNELAEVMVAASRIQHFPVNAPLLFVDENSILDLTKQELQRLKPEGVMMDGNVQVYLIGTIGDPVAQDLKRMGYRYRRIRGDTPIQLAVEADTWTSTQHGDHRNAVAIANLDRLEPAIPSAFWNAHRGDGLAFVTDEGIPEETKEILRSRANGPWIYVFGDESVVSEETVRELAQYGQVTRIPGSTPGEVSAALASFHDEGENWGAWIAQGSRSFGWGIREPGHNAIFINIDGPEGWQNAFSATTLSHMGKHAPVLILDDGRMPASVERYLRATRPFRTAPRQQLLNHGLVIGGPRTISWDMQTRIDLLMDGYVELDTDEEGEAS